MHRWRTSFLRCSDVFDRRWAVGPPILLCFLNAVLIATGGRHACLWSPVRAGHSRIQTTQQRRRRTLVIRRQQQIPLGPIGFSIRQARPDTSLSAGACRAGVAPLATIRADLYPSSAAWGEMSGKPSVAKPVLATDCQHHDHRPRHATPGCVLLGDFLAWLVVMTDMPGRPAIAFAGDTLPFMIPVLPRACLGHTLLTPRRRRRRPSGRPWLCRA